jgi:hypothetical protein
MVATGRGSSIITPNTSNMMANQSMMDKRKSQIPWRNPDKGPKLYECLFPFAVTMQIHLAPKKGINQAGENFTMMLFQQSEFASNEVVKAKQLRKQYDDYILDRAKHHAWTEQNGGVTGNLSNHAGDLNGAEKYIKQILYDKEEYEAAKQFKVSQSKNLEKNELEALMQGISRNSKKSLQQQDTTMLLAARKVTANRNKHS